MSATTPNTASISDELMNAIKTARSQLGISDNPSNEETHRAVRWVKDNQPEAFNPLNELDQIMKISA